MTHDHGTRGSAHPHEGGRHGLVDAAMGVIIGTAMFTVFVACGRALTASIATHLTWSVLMIVLFPR
ncbi:MAG: hypothetical protein ABI658_08715 [Acidimicrobiales bacterium]